MVAERGFLAPLAREQETGVAAAVAIGTAAVAMAGEVGGVTISACRRRLHTHRWRDGLRPLVLEDRPISEPSSPSRQLSFTPPAPHPAPNTVPRTGLSAMMTPAPEAVNGRLSATATGEADAQPLRGAWSREPTLFAYPPAELTPGVVQTADSPPPGLPYLAGAALTTGAGT